jgi:Heterokaryon incompatibility protein (HET)
VSKPLLGTITASKNRKANLAKFQNSIDFNLLPKTFQDAVSFVRRLGIRYLWIDALCIVQDDPDDWRRESAKMASIYQQSFLTIAASRSPDGKSGCFCQATKEETGFEVIPEWGLYMRQQIVHPDFTSLHASSEDSSVQDSVHESKLPLLKRGWVLQERLLSPRVLHFGETELIWECMESIDCECSGIRMRTKGFSVDDTKQIFRDNLSTMPPSELETLWRDTVKRYTTLDLTFHKDRLPAISGLASHIQKFRHDRYFHGMWEQSILRDLIWAVRQDTLRQRPAGLTWSWATVNSAIWYPRSYASHIPVKELCKVVRLPLPPSASTGDEDQEPVLGLSGPVIAADHRIHYQTGASEDPGLSYHCVYIGDDESYCYPDYPWYAEGPDRLKDSERIHLLKISEDNRLWTALVMKCVCHQTDKYKRIGVMHTSISNCPTILKGFEGVEDRPVNLI